MQLSPQQADAVRAWASEGASLSDIQTRLADEFGIRISYLDTRFLLIDLKVDLAEKPEKKPAPDALASAAAPSGAAALDDSAPDPYDPTGRFPDEADGGYPPEDAPGGSAGADPAEPPQGGAADGAAPDGAPASGSVEVGLDRIQRPGFAASGTLTCSDGTKGDWGIDAYGRIALAFPGKKGYRPSAADQQAFMQRLQTLLGGY